ncbi:molybdate transport system permease protein [Terrimicrobium sacchariphilum]|uniref:Molybdenum transport system permease n=1 Tax=Terrimicrobium sacchariphilum TaxID=690879 RepID=A0A146G5K4_TERSA|nr:molybdate ABC transporter permease subunit [Terrimicrobium sacchariphilum]GAT32880.1 molybdate transport system permease protein [Terrimicrobium sacchariphilum]
MDTTPIWLSLKTTVTATVITFILGILAARWRFGARGHWVGLVDAMLLLPLALPPTVIGLALLLFFGRNSPVGTLLSDIGIDVIFSWQATVITAVVASFPLMYQSAYAAFQQIDTELLDVGRLYGMNEWQLLWRVMLALAWPGILVGTILSFVRALGEFGATLMLAGSIPGRTQTIPLAIFFHVESGEIYQAGLLALVTLMISVAVLFIVRLPQSARVPLRR